MAMHREERDMIGVTGKIENKTANDILALVSRTGLDGRSPHLGQGPNFALRRRKKKRLERIVKDYNSVEIVHS